jgi:membrane protease YdiL (CAAX protease family)
VINGIGLAWKAVVEALGYPSNEQDLVGLFRDCDDPVRWVVMVLLATVLAPLTEELVFRAGLFRFLRNRLPRGMALIIPAIIFALLHGNLVAIVPLSALGVFFALAYEHTGRISVPIIAHALFNLHTILLVMAGVSD